jgi:hypothetical protein
VATLESGPLSEIAPDVSDWLSSVGPGTWSELLLSRESYWASARWSIRKTLRWIRMSTWRTISGIVLAVRTGAFGPRYDGGRELLSHIWQVQTPGRDGYA